MSMDAQTSRTHAHAYEKLCKGLKYVSRLHGNNDTDRGAITSKQ